MRTKTRVRAGRHAPGLHQRGVAVITALLLTTLAITIVASLFWQQQVQVRSIENQRLQLQKQWILRGALDWARLILREDAKYSSIDTLDEPWAVPLSDTRLDQYVENGREDTDMGDASLSGGITDAQSRYNLANLCPRGSVNPNEVAVFARLLTSLQLDPALAQKTADAIALSLPRQMNASRGATGNVNTANPANADNAANTPVAAAGNTDAQPMGFSQVDDLLAVPGYTADMVDKLRDYVIVLPRPTPVNVNTASQEVLAARVTTLSAADATALVASRKTASFKDIGDFSHRVPGGAYSAPPNEVSVMTNYFIVKGKVRMSRAGLEVQSLIERNGANTKIIWIREY